MTETNSETALAVAAAAQPGSTARSMAPDLEAALIEHYAQFRRFLARRVGDSATAEDVLQTFCLRVLSHRAALRNRQQPIGWMYAVLRSVLTDHYRSDSARMRRESSYAQEQMMLDADHAEIEVEAQACTCLNEVLPDLRSDYAEILQRVDLAGEARDKIAAEFGITSANMRVRLHRGRQALRNALARRCGDCCAHDFHDCQCRPAPVEWHRRPEPADNQWRSAA